MDEDEMRKQAQARAVQYLNSQFGSDVEAVHKKANECKQSCTDIMRRFQNQLSCVTSDMPDKLRKAVNDAAVAAQSLERVSGEQDLLIGDICNHIVDVTPHVKRLSALTSQIHELEKYTQYLLCLSQFEDLSSDISSALLINSLDRSVAQFVYMAQLSQDLQSSRCHHLLMFTQSTVKFWYNILREKLANEFDECLRAWQWPFIVAAVKPAPIVNASEVKEKLGNLFCLLAQLHIADEQFLKKTATDTSQQPNSNCTPTYRSPLLPIQLLARPLQKRFVYHFREGRKTNNREKPEWFFTQILTWIREHQDFLTTRIQPEVNKSCGGRQIDAMVEFAQCLVVLAVDKLRADMSVWLENEPLFAHLIDETLAFHRELDELYSYPSDVTTPSCLQVLTEPEPFRAWIVIERKFALEKMDAMLSSATAWQSQYRDLTDVDDMKVSECGEAFMTLLITITNRYKLLPSPTHRVEFFGFQLELLDDYRIRLVQIRQELLSTSNDGNPITSHYCSILNTVVYIMEIIQRWANLPFFVKLQYYKRQEMNAQLVQIHQNESHRSEADLASGDNRSIEKNGALDNVDDGSVFDDMIALLELMRTDMLRIVLSYAADDVKARSRPYRKDKWLALPSQKEFISMALSNSACEMLHILKDRLQQVERLLSRRLFTEFWQGLALELNNYIYRELILENNFNEGGAVQLQFDMTRNLFPMFGAYTTKSENYFKDVKEACIVLALSTGSALLIKDILYRALHEPQSRHSSKVTDPIAALHDIGIYKLEPEEVEHLLSLRVDLLS